MTAARDWEEFRVERVSVEGGALTVRVGGSGPPVALLHGFPQHSLMWRTVAPVLAERFTVIAPDQRGMGTSVLPDVRFTKTDMARDLAVVLDALGHERAHVVGYDLGAGVAVAFAREYPHRVERLGVMEFVAAGFGLEEAMAPRKGWNVESNWHFSVLAAPDVAAWLFRGRERELLDWFFGHESHQGATAVSSGDLDTYARLLSRPGALRAGAQYYASIFQDGEDNASLRARPLAMPVLAVGGASHAGPLLAGLWGPVATMLETAVIPAAGHWLCDENPAATAEALLKFLRSEGGLRAHRP
ncbi:alpha/beta fold hydrolase [Arenibaculum pallidiluteum]|uniref:alpha/beta fold hydrolase n=1 Tax=Arenibaculum pallidiluteum TaxID=2812559 RepID=UPI001A9618E7|nr:alpha/beta hydrolase [Arenibaculum pallidiluteum]